MLSVLILCLAMFSAAWAYSSLMRSGEFGFGDMPVKYRVFLALYALVALFILWAGGPIVFLVYLAIAVAGAACGWLFTKEGTARRDGHGGGNLRIPVRMQVITDGNTDIGRYARNADNAAAETVSLMDDTAGEGEGTSGSGEVSETGRNQGSPSDGERDGNEPEPTSDAKLSNGDNEESGNEPDSDDGASRSGNEPKERPA